MTNDKDLIEIHFSREEISVSEKSPSFESVIAIRAEEVLSSEGNDPSWYRLADIGIEDDGFVAIMRKIDRELKEEIEESECLDEIKFSLDHEVVEEAEEEVEEGPRADAEESQPKPSAAYDGPWSDRKFEIDVVQMCAILDLVNYAMEVSKPVENGGLGAITETLPRSLGVVNNLCIKNTCIIDQEEIRKAVESGRRVEMALDEGFKEHFIKWTEESFALFEKQYGSHRKVVQAKMMPGRGFDPRGNRGKGGLVRP